MTAYFAVVEKEPGSDYGVFFPDHPGCVTAGTDFNQAYAWAHEVLALHLDGERPETLPRPSTLAEIETNDIYRMAKDNVVAVILVSLDERALAA